MMLKSLIPSYMANRKQDIETFQEALNSEDYHTIKSLAHQIKGSGAGYGFHALTDFGNDLEQYADDEDRSGIQECLHQMAHYINCIDVTFV